MDAPAPQPAFVIDDEAKMNWLLRKMLEIDAAIEAAKANSKAVIESLESDKARLKARFDPDVEQYLHARIYEQSNLKGDGEPKRKTFQFLFGKAGLRSRQPGFVVEDKVAALEYAKAHIPVAVKTTVVESLDAEAYKQAATDGGEVLPGLVFKEGGDFPLLQPGKPREGE